MKKETHVAKLAKHMGDRMFKLSEDGKIVLELGSMNFVRHCLSLQKYSHRL